MTYLFIIRRHLQILTSKISVPETPVSLCVSNDGMDEMLNLILTGRKRMGARKKKLMQQKRNRGIQDYIHCKGQQMTDHHCL